MKPERIILDTNIWLSYFKNNRPQELADLIISNGLTVLTSPYLVAELEDVLKRPKFRTDPPVPVPRFVDFHLSLTALEITTPRFQGSPDPMDNFLFDLAIQHQATHLVTGEKRLLALKELEEVQIIKLIELKAFF